MNDKIAIIGMALKFPGADNPDEYWANLCAKIDCAGDFPENRKNKLLPYLNHTQKKNVNWKKGAYLNETAGFDYKYFKIPKVEAVAMSPQQRLFLQMAVAAMEDGGYGGKRLYSKKVGVYVGYIGDNELITYQHLIEASREQGSTTGALSANIAGRLSYFMDFKGPSVLIDSACSSSFGAVHAAYQGIRNGECDMAIVGGVQLNIFPDAEIELGVESADGHTRPFDDNSSGTGVSEGVAAVLLKPLKKAIRDNDHIYSCILSVTGNQDGRSIGMSAPNPQAQISLILDSMNEAQLKADDFSYCELHGTGTKIGDPIEFRALQAAFKISQRNPLVKCLIGSVKANVGHMFACSGLASLIKCCLMMKYKKISPQINLNQINKEIDLNHSFFEIHRQLTEWNSNNENRICGISNFGFSGTNYHLILSEPPQKEKTCKQKEKDLNSCKVFILSAMTRESLKRSVRQQINYLSRNKNNNLTNICYTLATGRGHYKYRLAISCKNIDELLKALNEFNFKTDINQKIYFGKVNIVSDKRIKAHFNDFAPMEIKKLSSQWEKVKNEQMKCCNEVNIERICMLYIQGADVQWEEFYQNKHVEKVSLPTYAFDEVSCWPAY